MSIERASNESVTLSSNAVLTIKNPVALAIWTVIHANGRRATPEAIRRHFGVGRARYAAAMKHLRELGLIEDIVPRDLDGRVNGRALFVRVDGGTR